MLPYLKQGKAGDIAMIGKMHPQFLKNDKGVTSLEFAFVAPALLLLTLATVEFSLIMFTNSVMESATTSTARFGKTGYVEEGSTREEQIVANIRNKTAGILDPSKITLTTKVYPMFDDIGAPEPYTDSNGNGSYNTGEPFSDINGNGNWDSDMADEGAGDANDVVVYTVSYPWPIFTPFLSAIMGSVYTINTRTVVKNEPYNIQNL